jgi:glyoxylase-like metal-dependent hydrolase (beta-lactamase superfamily II)
VALLDRKGNRLFAGDFIYPSSIFAFLPGANLQDYRRSARQVMQVLDEASTVYGGHGCDALPAVDVPAMRRADVVALERSLAIAVANRWRIGGEWYPRVFLVNERMKLLAKYPWMRP